MNYQQPTLFKKILTIALLVPFFVLSTGIHIFAQVESDPGASTTLSITSINPTSANVGSSVLVVGTAFVPGSSIILIDGKIGATITASSTTNITFTIPTQTRNDCFQGLATAIPGCDQTPTNLTTGSHTVAVKTPTQISNSKVLTIGNGSTDTSPRLTILSPNINAAYRVGSTYTTTYRGANLPTQGAIVIEMIGSVGANSFTLGTVNSIPSSESLYYNIPETVPASQGSTVTKAFPTGLYKLRLSVYNKTPCNGTANCVPATLLATDESDNFFTVVSETSPTPTQPEHTQSGGEEGGEAGEIPEIGVVEEGEESESPSVLEGLATVTATCAVTTLVGNAAKATLTAIVSAAGEFLKTTVGNVVSDVVSVEIPPKVPVKDSVVQENTGKVAKKEYSLTSSTDSNILGGFIKDLFKAPSLDEIGFCIANELIHYIVQSTIVWINSGFQGKPVFVENAGAFLQDIADREAGNFVQEILGESIGIDVCAPFRVQLVIDTIGGYTNTYANQAKCRLSTIKNNYNGFIQDWNQGGLPGWFELIQQPNNIHGARILAQDELRTRISQRQNTVTLELNWAKGYKNFKYCDGPTRADGSCDPKYEKTGTPGQMIESVINQRIGSAERRLEIADEFDELVSALVNQLVKIAVNEVLSIGQN